MNNTIQWRGMSINASDLCNIKNIAVLVTNNCNSDCYHCFRNTEKQNSNSNLSTILRLSEYLNSSNVELFHITGGEPFLMKGLEKVFSAYSELGITTSVVSNGYFLTSERLAELHASGLKEISLSVHSHDEVIHNQLTRTSGGFKRLVVAIKEAKNIGFYVRINLPLSTCNISTLKQTIKWLEELNVDRIKILRISPFGKASPLTNFEHLTDSEWITLSNELNQLFSNSTIPIKIQRIPKLKHNVTHGYCTVVPFRHLNIDNYGDIYPCCLLNGIERYSLGNISRIFEIGWKNATQEFANKILEMKELYDSEVLPCLQNLPQTQSSNICPLYSSDVSKNNNAHENN